MELNYGNRTALPLAPSSKDIYPGSNSSNPQNFIDVNGTSFSGHTITQMELNYGNRTALLLAPV